MCYKIKTIQSWNEFELDIQNRSKINYLQMKLMVIFKNFITKKKNDHLN